MYIFRLGCLHVKGKAVNAISEGIQVLSSSKSSIVKSQVLLVLCYISRFEGMAQNQYDFSKALINLSEKEQMNDGLINGLSFLGEYYFNKSEIKKANSHLKRAFENKFNTIGIIAMNITWLYARTLFVLGKEKKAMHIIEKEIESATIEGNGFILAYLKGMRSHLLLKGNKGEIPREWLLNTKFNSQMPITETYSLIYTKLLVESKFGQRDKDFEMALLDSLKANNYKNALAQVYMSSISDYLKHEDFVSAEKKMSIAAELLPFNSFVEIYKEYEIDEDLFHRLCIKSSGIEKQRTSPEFELTNREAQIANLYASRITDKEIAEKLGVSLSTVKRHNVNIFNKLQVSSKREAMKKLFN